MSTQALLLCFAVAYFIALAIQRCDPDTHGPDFAKKARAKAISISMFFFFLLFVLI